MHAPNARRLAPLVLTLAVLSTRCAEPRRAPTTPLRTSPGAQRPHTAPTHRLRALRTFPHPGRGFTQGLVWHDGTLWESTGLYKRSTLRKLDLSAGTVARQARLPGRVFAEGLTRIDDRLIQLSWREGEARVWTLPDLTHARTHRYTGQGWGLCYDGTRLIMSDGTALLTFRDPDTFAPTGRLRVRAPRPAALKLNALECARGHVYANVWPTDTIAKIDPRTGHITAWIDASGLLAPAERRDTDVLNGIAYKPDTDTFLITGKRWPKLFEVAMP